MACDIRSESFEVLTVFVGGGFCASFFVDLVEGVSLEVVLHHFV